MTYLIASYVIALGSLLAYRILLARERAGLTKRLED